MKRPIVKDNKLFSQKLLCECVNWNFKHLFVLSILILFVPQLMFSQRSLERGYNSMSEAQARNYVEFLADDLLCGREAATDGSRIAARYIVSLLKEWGVEPLFASGYTQEFDAYIIEYNDNIRWTLKVDSAYLQACKLYNIMAVIPGEITNEYVVVGAHYDHLGTVEAVNNDSCFNGADDNASGVSAVLQIAKAMKLSGKRPKRSIIFAFWDGEEKGLLGSSAFVARCSDINCIKAYMNFDMVGRGPVDNPAYLKYFFTASHPEFGDWLRSDMKKRKFCFAPDYISWDKPYSGSDNAPFARAGVPIVWYHTEGHPDYHRPSDSADKIDYPKLLDITRAAFLCVWRMAND